MKIFVIVLNWCDAPSTERCVGSLFAQTTIPTEVVVVDNGSDDGSFERLQGLGPNVTVLQTGGNLGYAGGNNVGIRYSLARGADWVWILNNDTIVGPDCLDELLKFAHSSTSGVMVPTIRLGVDPPLVWYAGGDLDPRRCVTRHRGWMSPSKPSGLPSFSPVTFATGCSLFVRRDVFEKVGLLNETFFMYWEDAEFSWRLLSHGVDISYVPSAEVRHSVGSASGSSPTIPSPFGLYYRSRNRLWFARSLSPGNRAVAYAWTVPTTLRGLQAAVRGPRRRRWSGVKAVLRGVRDGVMGTPESNALIPIPQLHRGARIVPSQALSLGTATTRQRPLANNRSSAGI